MKLDLGCGTNPREGYIGVDRFPNENVDIVCNMEQEKLPFDNNTIDAVYSRHFFEHIQNFDWVLREIYRVCHNHADVEIIVPHFTRPPYEWHIRHYRYNCFIDYEIKKPSMLGIPKLFRCMERRLEFGKGIPLRGYFFNKFPKFYEYSCLKSLFPCSQIYIWFKVVK